MDLNKKINIVARKISFLMPHQEVLPDLKEIINTLYEGENNFNEKDSAYILGAYDALMALIIALEQKGPHINE